MALKGRNGAREISVPDLQDRLRRSGAVLETPTRLAVTGHEDWRANRN